MKDDLHWSTACFLAWVFFWVFGLPPLAEGYGYADWKGDLGDLEDYEDKAGGLKDSYRQPSLNICTQEVSMRRQETRRLRSA